MGETTSPSSLKEKIVEANFNLSTSDFGEVVKTSYFVDKTPLIKSILNDAPALLITAPRRFGKSTNLDMLKKFVEIQINDKGLIIDRKQSPNRKIFEDNNLLVFQDNEFFEQHFAKYPIIHVSFKSVTGNNFDEVMDSFKYVLHKTFEQHQYLLRSNKLDESQIDHIKRFCNTESFRDLTEVDIGIGLSFLSKYIHKYFDNKKIFMLIDDYDAPLHNLMFKENIDIKEVNEVLSQIFTYTLKRNNYIRQSIVTGISHFATVIIPGGKKCMFLTHPPFVPYYGLTENEVDKLLTDFEINNEIQDKVKLYYGGYLGLNGTKLFSIWSILNFLQNKEIKSYWEDSGVMVYLEEAMNNLYIIQCVEALCLEKSVGIEIVDYIPIEKIDELKNMCLHKANFESAIYLYFLLQEGYLTFAKGGQGEWSAGVGVPNAEILCLFREKLLKHYGDSINSCIAKCADTFEKISSSPEDGVFIDFLTKFNEILDKLKGRFTELREDSYHCILFFILNKTKFSVNTEFIVCDSNLRIIVELKYKKSSEEALKYAMEKYGNGSDKNKEIGKCIFMGLNVNENNVADLSMLIDSTNLSNARRFCI